MALQTSKSSLLGWAGRGSSVQAFQRIASFLRRSETEPWTGNPAEGHCVLPSAPSRDAHAALRADSAAWRAEEQKLGRIVPQAVLLLEDLFHFLYEPDVPLNLHVHPAFHWNFSVIATLRACPDSRRLQARTAGNALQAALAAVRLAEEATSEKFLSAAQRKALRRAWRRRGFLPLLPLGIGVPPAEPDLVFPLAHGLRRTRAALDADAALRRAWGLDGGNHCSHRFDDVQRLLEMVRGIPGFADLTAALEQFRRLLRRRGTQRREGWVGRTRVMGYTLGQDVSEAAPEEMVKLTDRGLEGLFYEAYEHRRLLQHAYTGQGRQNRGPLICCMDVSRSMNAPAALGRERFLWAKAVGLAMLDVAQRAKRPFLGVCFSSGNEVACFPVDGPAPNPETALAMARCDFNGGTRFDVPLQKALDYAQEHGGREGHVVFITDGEAPLPTPFRERFLQAKARLGLELLTVFIDGEHAALAEVSDRVYRVTSERTESWERVLLAVADRVETPRG